MNALKLTDNDLLQIAFILKDYEEIHPNFSFELYSTKTPYINIKIDDFTFEELELVYLDFDYMIIFKNPSSKIYFSIDIIKLRKEVS